MRNIRFACFLFVTLILLCTSAALFCQPLDKDTLAKFDYRIPVNKYGWGNSVSFTGKGTCIVGKPKLTVRLSHDGKFVIITPQISIKGDDGKMLSEKDLLANPWLVPNPKRFQSHLSIGCGPRPLHFDPASVKNGSIYYSVDDVVTDKDGNAQFYFFHQVIRGNVITGRATGCAMTTLHIPPKIKINKHSSPGSSQSDSSQTNVSSSTSKYLDKKKLNESTKTRKKSPPVAWAEVEKQHASGKSLIGVAADGASILKILLHFTKPGNDTNRRAVKEIKISQSPAGLGYFTQKISGKFHKIPSSGEIILKNWDNSLVYHPPEYLTDDSQFKSAIKLKATYLNISPAYGIPCRVKLVFKTGKEKVNQVCKFIVVRPPVFLVHGFTGDKTTWESLDVNLNKQKFKTVREAYFESSGKSGINDLQKLLKFYVDRELKAFTKTGIRLSKVDIVAHSMGGLIARAYIKALTDQGKTSNVRKLIMVGAPNHGVEAELDQFAGLVSQKFELKHKQGLRDLKSTSKLIRKLNRNEASGGHLNPNVEYANIIGKLQRHNQHHDFYLDSQDGVITNASSHLNQVIEFVYPAHIHSPARALTTIWPNNTALTLSKQVFLKIRECLLHKISRQGMDHTSISLQTTKGAVTIQGPFDDSLKAPAKPPCPLYVGTRFVTGPDGGAVIRFSQKNKRWGDVAIGSNTDLYIEFASPKWVHIYMAKGRVRCKT